MRHYSSSARQDAAHVYQQQIRNIPLLGVNEERDLARGVQRGQHKSRDQMIIRNLRLVMSLARRYEHRRLGLMDLVSEGHIGLIRAVEKFDPERGFRFSTYATLWIRQSIERALMNQERTVRLPIHVIKHVGRCLRVRHRLSQRLGRPVSLRELAVELDMSLDRLQQLLGWHAAATSSDELLERGSGDEIMDEQLDPDRLLQDTQMNLRVHAWLERLSPRERAVVACRFGFDRQEAATLESIGSHVGLTRERVRQILLGALAQMREMADEDGIEGRQQL